MQTKTYTTIAAKGRHMAANTARVRMDGLGRGIESLMGNEKAAPKERPVAPPAAPAKQATEEVSFLTAGKLVGVGIAGTMAITACAVLGTRMALALFSRKSK